LVDTNELIANMPKIMYVDTKEGLRKRSEPSVNSDIIGTLLYGERIIVFTKTNDTETIDNITDYWYSTTYNNNSWIFGGYLSEDLPSDLPIILGKWDNVNREIEMFEFKPNHNFANARKESDIGTWGTWELSGDRVIVHLTSGGVDVGIMDETIEFELITIDRNNIKLIYPNKRTVELRRSNDLW